MSQNHQSKELQLLQTSKSDSQEDILIKKEESIQNHNDESQIINKNNEKNNKSAVNSKDFEEEAYPKKLKKVPAINLIDLKKGKSESETILINEENSTKVLNSKKALTSRSLHNENIIYKISEMEMKISDSKSNKDNDNQSKSENENEAQNPESIPSNQSLVESKNEEKDLEYYNDLSLGQLSKRKQTNSFRIQNTNKDNSSSSSQSGQITQEKGSLSNLTHHSQKQSLHNTQIEVPFEDGSQNAHYSSSGSISHHSQRSLYRSKTHIEAEQQDQKIQISHIHSSKESEIKNKDKSLTHLSESNQNIEVKTRRPSRMNIDPILFIEKNQKDCGSKSNRSGQSYSQHSKEAENQLIYEEKKNRVISDVKSDITNVDIKTKREMFELSDDNRNQLIDFESPNPSEMAHFLSSHVNMNEKMKNEKVIHKNSRDDLSSIVQNVRSMHFVPVKLSHSKFINHESNSGNKSTIKESHLIESKSGSLYHQKSYEKLSLSSRLSFSCLKTPVDSSKQFPESQENLSSNLTSPNKKDNEINFEVSNMLFTKKNQNGIRPSLSISIGINQNQNSNPLLSTDKNNQIDLTNNSASKATIIKRLRQALNITSPKVKAISKESFSINTLSTLREIYGNSYMINKNIIMIK